MIEPKPDIKQKEQPLFSNERWNVEQVPPHEILNNIPAAIYLTDAEGHLTFYNKAAAEFSGHQPELGSDKWCVTWKLYHPDGTFMPHDTCPMAIAVKEGRSIRGAETIAERPDGKRIWFRPYPTPLRDQRDRVVGGINMLIDITDEKKADERLSQNERQLNDFFENASIGLHWVGADGTILRANQAELDMLGYTREEYIGQNITRFHVDKEVIDDILHRLKAGEQLNDYEARLRCKNGSMRYVRINSNVYSVDGKFVHTRCCTHDVTNRKLTEQALLVNEERLASKVADLKRLHELSTELIKQNNIESALKEVVKASAELMNADKASVQMFEPEENVLRLIDTIGFDRKFSQKFLKIDANGFTTCAAAFRNHTQVLVDDFNKCTDFNEFGRIATSYGMNAVLSTPLFGNSGQLFGVFSMYWDKPHKPDKEKLQLLDLYTQQASRLIDRQKAEQALMDMNETLEDRVKERTAALMSYQEQLKSLTTRLSKTEENERQRLAAELHDNLGQLLALSKIKLDQMLRNTLPKRAKTEVAVITDLINNATGFTRELMTDLQPPPSLEIEGLAANIAWVADKMKKHNLKVTVEEDHQQKILTEDIRRTLCLCIREVLFNVVKHSGTNEARIMLTRSGKHVLVNIEDRGTGFAIEEKQPYPTVDGGFGLFNIHERMDCLGGYMEIDSKPGKGTRIRLYAPVMEIDQADAVTVPISNAVPPSRSTSKDFQSRRQIKVLLVDDHKMVRAGLRNLIEEEKDLIVIGEATNGKEAVEIAFKTLPDVIVMDINMPVMDGIEATQIISSSNLNARIIGLSLHDQDNVIEAVKRAGASAYLTKTEAFEYLSAVIRSEAMIDMETKDQLPISI